ncbi:MULTISPECIES: hypothetical protein [unclassified Halomonas]|uniref:hypothetical protein n=1 Tax=unclassified Halomonas TaxID=2609666 RepID=UPI000990388F|nr:MULTISPECIES: hypothetical protein [unclassified Halomonas]AQU84856.1 hypothetical protein B2G49_21045 [Halomonas sp. 'Soap Lake \
MSVDNLNIPKIVSEQINLRSGSLVDLRGSVQHPLVFSYTEVFESAILECPFEYGRTQPCWRLDEESPFVKSVQVALKYSSDSQRYIAIYGVLEEFYQRFTHENAASYLGLRNDALAEVPPHGSVFPWRARTQKSYQTQYEKAAINENISVGIAEGISAGWLFCGPVRKEKLKAEALRMKNVFDSIQSKGYQRSDDDDGDVKATALINDNQEWRWLITAGNHRASAAAGLGYESIPVRINLIIRRCDVKYWPNVLSGLYTIEEALFVFDRVFYGSRP